MVRRVIQGEPGLTEEQISQIEYHSVLNLVNVAVSSLNIISIERDIGGRFDGVAELLIEVADLVRDARGHDLVIDTLSRARIAGRTALEGLTDAQQLMRLFDVLDMRLRELLARRGRTDEWIRADGFELFHSLELVFETMASLARGRYDIDMLLVQGGTQSAGDRSPPRAGWYHIELIIEGDSDESVCMPIMMTDTLRDLLANARKYSLPGTSIRATLEERSDVLLLTVADNGRGIPPDEIERVVSFGVRGSNTLTHETQGGGFGLTKAWWLAHNHGGTMSIASSTDRQTHGTEIQLAIPRPTTPGGGCSEDDL